MNITIPAFQPSEEIFKKIGFDKHSYQQYVLFSTRHSSVGESERAAFMGGLITHLREFYNIQYKCCWKLPFSCTLESLANAGTVFLALDGVRNSHFHGAKNPDDSYALGLWLGKEGLCFGFYDEGDYFKREDIKGAFEQRRHPFNLHLPDREGIAANCRGWGVSNIYEYSDFIEVDTTHGVLYAGQFAKRFLVPSVKD